MAESIGRYFRMMPVGRKVRIGESRWRPAADVYRTLDGWIVKLDLAGISSEDLDLLTIEVSGATLRIEGCRHDSFYGEGVSYHQLEITYSRFEKTLRFPCAIEGGSIVRDYRDGLLILRLRSKEDCDEDVERSS
jgi:HSP20 family protein